MSSLKVVTLQKPLARHLKNGHPWIWADALQVAKGPHGPRTGDVVDVVERDGRFVARGLYDAKSPIGVRVATLDAKELVDAAFIRRRVADALRARRTVIDASEVTGFRWLNGEGDRLPGVVVDVYANVAVLRLDGDAVRAWRDDVVAALISEGRGLGIEHVYERSRSAKGDVLHGEAPPATVQIVEHGARFDVDVIHGQKTGFFLDQRENRRLVRRYARGLHVANLFSYTGGFSVQAALGGAARVTSVDIAPDAIEAARATFTLNGLDAAKHEFIAADCFDWLEATRARILAAKGAKDAPQDARRFGLMIVDPPSFAPSERSLKAALQAYQKLNAAALGVVEDDGLIASASCSSHVTMDAFMEMLRDASVDAQRPLRILEVHGQPGDHPTPPAFKEGRYLKFVLARVGAR